MQIVLTESYGLQVVSQVCITFYLPDLVSCFQSSEFPSNGSGNQSAKKTDTFIIMLLISIRDVHWNNIILINLICRNV